MFLGMVENISGAHQMEQTQRHYMPDSQLFESLCNEFFRSPLIADQCSIIIVGGLHRISLVQDSYPVICRQESAGAMYSFCHCFVIVCHHTSLPPHQPCHPSPHSSCHHTINLNIPCSNLISFSLLLFHSLYKSRYSYSFHLSLFLAPTSVDSNCTNCSSNHHHSSLLKYLCDISYIQYYQNVQEIHFSRFFFPYSINGH